MIEENIIISNYDGVKLSIALSTCEQGVEPRGIVQIVHGMCEHKERYFELMSFLSSKAYICVCHDHRGHGKIAMENGDLGYMNKGGWEALVEDSFLVSEWVKAKYPGLGLCLLGHSMGSLVVRSYLKRHDDAIEKLIVCGSPSDNPAKAAGVLLAGFLGLVLGEKSRPKILQAISLGSYNKGFEAEGYPCAWVCSNKEVLEAYHKDLLCMYSFTANGFKNLFALMCDCYSSKGWGRKNLALPVWFISGENDPCLGNKKQFLAAVDAVRKIGYSCEYKLYPNMRHEIHNETDKQQVWDDILAFISR